MFAVDPLTELFRTLRFPLEDAPVAPRAASEYVGTLRVEGRTRGWLEIWMPEPLARASAARLLARDPGELDELAALDGVQDLLAHLRERLAEPGRAIGEPTVAVRATNLHPGRAAALVVDGHPVQVRFAAAA